MSRRAGADSNRPLMPVAEALNRITAMAAPLGEETVSLIGAAGRALRRDVAAIRAQPPFDAAQMDGYAVALGGDAPAPAGERFALKGEARAAPAPRPALAPGEAVRIFTGAPMPAAQSDARLAVALQEDASVEGGAVSFSEPVAPGRWIRPSGLDFSAGDVLLRAPRRLTPEDVALAASAGAPWLTVARRPRVALLTLGDELRLPGEILGPDHIHASNQFGVGALLTAAGAEVTLAPVAPDDLDALQAVIEGAAGADLIVTLGGASEGDHDLARPAFAALGMTPDFYKIAMRPGKPLMAGNLAARRCWDCRAIRSPPWSARGSLCCRRWPPWRARRRKGRSGSTCRWPRRWRLAARAPTICGRPSREKSKTGGCGPSRIRTVRAWRCCPRPTACCCSPWTRRRGRPVNWSPAFPCAEPRRHKSQAPPRQDPVAGFQQLV